MNALDRARRNKALQAALSITTLALCTSAVVSAFALATGIIDDVPFVIASGCIAAGMAIIGVTLSPVVFLRVPFDYHFSHYHGDGVTRFYDCRLCVDIGNWKIGDRVDSIDIRLGGIEQ